MCDCCQDKGLGRRDKETRCVLLLKLSVISETDWLALLLIGSKSGSIARQCASTVVSYLSTRFGCAFSLQPLLSHSLLAMAPV